jgi:hypothetical protein
VTTAIEAAWIGVAGVAVGGLITIAVTVVNARLARRVAEASILGEHRQRLWEKQSFAYEEAVKEVLARQTRREALMSRGDVGNIGSHPAEEMRRAEEPEGIQIRAGLRPYASKAVWKAYENADQANTAVWMNLVSLAGAQSASQLHAECLQAHANQDEVQSEPDYQGALTRLHQSRKDALDAEEALFDAINRELGWRSSHSGDGLSLEH